MKRKLILILMLLAAVIALSACEKKDALKAFEKLDISEYEGMKGYEKDSVFVEVEVKDAIKLMDEGETFVLFISFPDCPWCNTVISHLNDVALENGSLVASINTRKDPSWQNNSDLKDFDLFVERFGEYLSDVDTGKKLYVPHTFFIKNGKVVYEYQGAHPNMGNDPNYILSNQEIKDIENIFRKGFNAMK